MPSGTFPHPPRLEPCLRLLPHTAQHLWSIFIAKTMKRQFPFRPHSQMHSSVLYPLSPAYPPMRVQLARSLGPWFAIYSLYFFVPKARGRRRQSSSWCARLSRAQTTMPHPTLREGLGVSLGSPFPPSHSPSHPSRSLPCSVWRTQTACCRWRVPAGPIRSLRLPSHHTG